jgi:hypothetical protein
MERSIDGEPYALGVDAALMLIKARDGSRPHLVRPRAAGNAPPHATRAPPPRREP